MKAKVGTSGLQTIFTNNDEVPVQVSSKRDYVANFSPENVKKVELQVVCESQFRANGKINTHVHYSGSVRQACLTESGRDFAVYEGKVRFPRTSAYADEPLLGTSTFDHVVDGIRWFIRAKIYWNKPGSGEDAVDTAEHMCEFKPTAPLPNMLELIDTEHAEEFDGVPFSVTTTHAVAGLPQVPLATGISVRVACPRPNKFAIKRVRILLKEETILGDKSYERMLPTRRWLLSDVRPDNPLRLYNVTTELDGLLGNIYIDHPTLNPSFEMNGVSHRFDLICESTLVWPTAPQHVPHQMRKLTSISPVEVMPRIFGARYLPRRDSESNEEPFFDPAEITDTSDDEVIETDSESVSDGVLSVFSDHIKRDSEFAIPPLITSTIYE